MKYFCRYVVIELNKSGRDACHLHSDYWRAREFRDKIIEWQHLRYTEKNDWKQVEKIATNFVLLTLFLLFLCHLFHSQWFDIVRLNRSCFLWPFFLFSIHKQFIMFGAGFYTNLRFKKNELWLKVGGQQ